MSDILVGILGLVCIVAIVVTLFRSKTQPAIAFIVFPAVLGLIMVIGGRYSFDNLATMIKSGFNSTGPTAALFVFSVLYFGIMTDAGMFDVIIGKLMGLVGDNVIGVALVTAVIALVGHLDGGGASTFCIVIPAMLPVYKRMHMRTTTLLRIAVLSMGVLNLMPWAGPTMRAASVLGEEAGSLWQTILPIQIFGIALALAFDTDSYFYGMLPVVIGIGQAFGVDALPIVVAMVVCRNCATFISPMVPATLLGTGLAEVDIKDHIKASFLYVWGFSILCMLVAILFGIMPL